MSTYYLLIDGAKLVKQGDVLKLKKDGDVYNTVFPHKAEQIFILGNVEITTPAFKFLMKHRIDTVFLSKNGKFYGKLSFTPSKNVFLRIKQYKLLEDEEFGLNFAKTIVRSKIKNQIVFLQRVARRNNKSVKLIKTINRIQNLLPELEKATTIESVRGYEGMASKLYFGVFGYSLVPEFAKFEGRSKNPPLDNVNAVLSFLYTLIYFRVDGLLESEGIDSYAGFLHSLDYGRKSLSFDLMEEYRTPIAETLAVSLFNLGILNEGDFREVDYQGGEDEFIYDELTEQVPEVDILEKPKAVLLTRNGLKKVINHFERKLQTKIYYPISERRETFKKLMHLQISRFKQIVNGETATYHPLQIR